MDRYLKLSFENASGRNCKKCILSFSKGEHNHCTSLDNRPICSEDGCRKDCPLIDNVIDLPVIDMNDERYREVMTYNNFICADYTRNDYRDILKTKDKEELLQMKKDIDKMLVNIQILHDGLLQKQLACNDILVDMN